ncbi:putative ABC transport system permease protein [Mucilaginibacter mallensis]|uniref:Putative ABC transport system permease protein n=1 Tax=Mucilaginibacter mallensis TaxID=652787 RepID=A0A1H1ZTS1_MUCMA|nr:ABC transporter permease [Mucilaginibacter mallensis]SDT37104.1 putative ABC transport system permease protein [Mucilaginibacter mallensis]
MIKNIFKIALRYLWKDRVFSGINLLGLITSLSFVIVIMGYIQYELSFDKYYTNSPRVYRILEQEVVNGEKNYHVLIPNAIAQALKTSFPDFEAATSINKSVLQFSYRNEPMSANILITNSSFFKVFNFRFEQGNAVDVSKEGKCIVITRKFADKYFSGHNPLGQSIISKSNHAWKIAGVIETIPGNTHFNAEAMIISDVDQQPLNLSAYNTSSQYVLMREGADPKTMQQKLACFYKSYNFPASVGVTFQPVTSIHLHSNYSDELFENGNVKYIYIYATISFLVLLIACINFINLTTVRFMQRSVEVGIRKVMGAHKSQVFFQFITESILLFIIASPISYLVASLCWKKFSDILGLDVEPTYLFNAGTLLLVLLICMITGLISGLFPALYLTRVDISTLLKKLASSHNLKFTIRKVLIVAQFTVSVVLIISALLIKQQMILLNNADLGFNKTGLLILKEHDFGTSAISFKSELEKNGNVKDVSIASFDIGGNYGSNSTMSNPADTTKQWAFSFVDADNSFIKTMHIRLLAGTDFSTYVKRKIKLVSADSSKLVKNLKTSEQLIILTDKTVSLLQLKNPIGSELNYGGLQGTVIGVIKDFQGTSFHTSTPNVVIRSNIENNFGQTYIRIEMQNLPETLHFIEQKWRDFYPRDHFDFSFADDKVKQLYASEERLMLIVNFFTVLAICIACFGLFSLVAISISQRMKEVSIRKVLGAGITEIFILLTKDFFRLIVFSIIISIPITWFFMNKWLETFVYRISFNWITILISGILIIVVAFSIISFQIVKVAVSSPLKSLKSDN